MLKILINAYAVSPDHGSEPGVGWNWITQIAKYCKVYVITEIEFKNGIEIAVQKLPQKDNLVFYYNDIEEKARQMCWNQGDYRFYYYYRKWQQKTLSIAKKIVIDNKIDIIHQLNMIGYREPGYLWKIKNIPFIWGPVGGYNFVKSSFLLSLGFKMAVFYSLKNIINFSQAITSLRVRKAVKHATILLAASGNAKSAIKILYKKDSILINETGCHIPPMNFSRERKKNQNKFKILWVGRFIPTKMIGLALETISKVKYLDGLEFHIVGDGMDNKSLIHWQNYARILGIGQICEWHGKILRKEVDEIMRKSDLLFFPSIVEGTSHVILESISNSLPVLCFDTCGHGEIITDKIGIKIPLENPQKGVNQFVANIEKLYYNRDLLQQMSENCKIEIVDLSWDEKAKRMIKYYQKLL